MSVNARKRRCYIAGRMRGVPHENVPLFVKAAELLRDAGWDVTSPIELNHLAGLDPGKQGYTPAILRQIASMDINAVLSLEAEKGDILIIIDEWDKSVGTHAEVAAARFAQLPVFRMTILPFMGYDLDRLDVSL